MVADDVPVPVVDRLEVVEVENRHRQRATVPDGTRHLLGEALVKEAVIGETGQRIVRREPLEFGFVASALTDVADRRDPTEQRAIGLERRPQGDLGFEARAVTPLQLPVERAAAGREDLVAQAMVLRLRVRRPERPWQPRADELRAREAGDRAEGVVDLDDVVARREQVALPHRGHDRGRAIALLAQRPLDPLALGDVGELGDHSQRPAVLVADQRRRQLAPDGMTVAVTDPRLGPQRRQLAGEQSSHGLPGRGGVVGVGELVERQSQKLPFGVTEDLAQRPVDA